MITVIDQTCVLPTRTAIFRKNIRLVASAVHVSYFSIYIFLVLLMFGAFVLILVTNTSDN